MAANARIQLSTEHGEYFEKITSMLQQIGLNLNSLRRFPRLYPHNQRLEAAMVDVYRLIFRFCSEARNVFYKANDKKSCKKGNLKTSTTSRNSLTMETAMVGLQSMIKLVWKPFKVQFGDMQEELSTCMDRVSAEVELAEKEEAHKERENAKLERRTQALRWDKTEHTHQKLEIFFDEQSIGKVDQWLAPVDFKVNHEAATKLRHQGTGNWFLQGDEFKSWLEEDNSFLWLHATPGFGKTVLVSSSIEYLRDCVKSPEVGLAYFYCDYKDSDKQIPSKVLCTLLAQLARQHKVVFQRLQSFVQERIKESPSSKPSHDELRSNFATFLHGTFKQIILIVDAIDESTERRCIIGDLKTFSKSCPFIKILVSSREEHDINQAFKQFPQVKIRQSDVADDIESFVRAEVAHRIREKELTVRRPELQQTICEKLVDKSEGMFQWVKCQIEVLSSLGTDKAILKALEQMPKDLAGTYARILQRLEHDSENIHRYQKLLKWLVKSTRSLTLDELAECIGIDLEEDNNAMDFDSVETYPENLLKRCSSLVTVTDDGRVSLAHYTVKEFLVSETTQKDLEAFYVGDGDVEVELAQTCLTYLCFSDFVAGSVDDEEAFSALLEQYKFLEYAACSWGTHAHRSRGMEEDLVDFTTRLLKSESEGRGNYEFWLQVYQSRKATHHGHSSIFKPLFFAASFGLPRTLKSLLEDEEEKDLSDWSGTEADPIKESVAQGHTENVKILLEHYEISDIEKLGQYLYIASSKGHESIVRYLLDRGVDVDFIGGKQGTALQVAVLEGHRDVTQILLKNHASTKVVSARFGTPLSAAAEKGHERTFQLLLGAGAAINGKGGWFAYPLISAICGQNQTIIQILLNKGANVNLNGGRHVCALMAASALGNSVLVKKLIDMGAKVNDENDKGADALHSACSAGHLNIVHLLLENGADVNAKGGKHRNALNAASSEGFADIVETLLEAGAEPTAFDLNYGDALQAAARSGHECIVRALAKRGCDVSAEGGTRGSALVGAASSGKTRIVEVLYELGVPEGDHQDAANALVAATAKGHDDIVALLVSKGANLNTTGFLGAGEWLPLQLAANHGNFDMVSTLLGHGADPNAIGGFHGTALNAATDCKKPNCEILETLIVAGANINEAVPLERRSKYPNDGVGDSTALATAAIKGHLDAVELLLNHDADPNIQCGNYYPAIAGASARGYTDIIKVLLLNHADVNVESEPSNEKGDNGVITALQGAASFSDKETIQLLISEGADLAVERNDSDFKSALHAASYYGMNDNVKVLLDLGSDVNLRGGKWGSCLELAAMEGNVETMEILLDAGAEIDETEVGYFGSALIAAIAKNQHTAVKLLLEKGANPSVRGGGNFQYPIIAAARQWDNAEEVQLLIDAGADVNACGGTYYTALQAAAVDGNDSNMRVLLDAGADMHATGGKHGNALTAAYENGYYLCTGLLWQRGVSNELSGGRFCTPLGSALSGACQTLITFLIREHHVDPNRYLNEYMGSPLHYCIMHNRSDEDVLVPLFLDYGADPNGVGPSGLGGYYGTPLNAAVARGEFETVNTLLTRGADPTIRANKEDWTALQLACLYNNTKMFELLLNNKPDLDINAHGRYGTPLQAAAYRGNKTIIRDLLHRGADLKISGQGRYGHSLQSAAIRAREEAVRVLIKHGADVRVRGGRFGTVLQAASVRCSKELVDFLIHKGAQVDAEGGRYKTALQASCAAGNKEVVLTLLEHKANVKILGGRYGSALQAACVYGDLYVVRMLVEHGADVNAQGGFYGSALDAAALNGHEDVLRYLLHETDIKRKYANPNILYQYNFRVLHTADDLIQKALEYQEENQGAQKAPLEDEQEEEPQEPLMNVESIPKYNPATAPTDDETSSTSSPDQSADTDSHAATSASETTIPEPMPRNKRERRRMARNKSSMIEQTTEVNASPDEDMSALSWLQVTCGYGGDLNGPGR